MVNIKTIFLQLLTSSVLVTAFFIHCDKPGEKTHILNPPDSLATAIYGTVTGDGRLLNITAIPDASVKLYQGDSLVVSAHTDTNGRFNVPDVAENEYSLQVEKEYPYDNRAFTSVVLRTSEGRDLGTIRLDHIDKDYYPLRVGTTRSFRVIRTFSDYTVTKWIRTITVQNMTQQDDTTRIYPCKVVEEQYEKIWYIPYTDQIDSISHKSVMTSRDYMLKEINGILYDDYYSGFHLCDGKRAVSLATFGQYVRTIGEPTFHKEYAFGDSLYEALEFHFSRTMEDGTGYIWAANTGPLSHQYSWHMFESEDITTELIEFKY